MQIQQIALDKLVPAKAPVRHTNGGGIDALEASIESVGLLQNLGVVPLDTKGAKFQVIFGNHRLQAMRNLVKRKAKGWNAGRTVGCLVAKTKEALDAAIAENVIREPLHIVDEWEAFAALSAEGLKDQDIAARFGWSDRKLRQVVALGRLHKDIRALVRTGKMSVDTAQAYANAGDPTAQKKLFDSLKQQARNAWSVRQAMANMRIPVAHALFDQKKAKLATEAELFPVRDDGKPTEHFLDTDKFWALQNDAIAGLEGELQKAGWAKVTVKRGAGAYDLPSGVRLSDKSLAKAKRADGGVQINVGKDGRVMPQYWLSEKAAIAAAKAKAKEQRAALDEIGEAPPKPGVDRAYPRNVLAELFALKSLMLQDELATSAKGAVAFAIWSMVQPGKAIKLVSDPARHHIGNDHNPAVSESEIGRRAASDVDLPMRLGLRQMFAAMGGVGDPRAADDIAISLDLHCELMPGQGAGFMVDLMAMEFDALLKIFAAIVARAAGYDDGDKRGRWDGRTANNPAMDALAGALALDPRTWWRPSAAFFARLPRKTLLDIAKGVFDEDFIDQWRGAKVGELAKAIAERWTWDGASEGERSRRDYWLPPALRVPVADDLHDGATDPGDAQREDGTLADDEAGQQEAAQ